MGITSEQLDQLKTQIVKAFEAPDCVPEAVKPWIIHCNYLLATLDEREAQLAAAREFRNYIESLRCQPGEDDYWRKQSDGRPFFTDCFTINSLSFAAAYGRFESALAGAGGSDGGG